eukprot:Lankesteria_metandrocarpae@DN5056_c0_g3_i2.p2
MSLLLGLTAGLAANMASPALWCQRRLVRSCLAALHFLEWSMKLLGASLVVAALALIGMITTTYFCSFLPSSVVQSTAVKVLLTMCGVVILVNVVYFHYMVCCTDPGLPPMLDVNAFEMKDPLEAGEFEEIAICRKCNTYKPPRCHHCSVCSRCVLKMDHHCPWINQCVGFRNYPFFLLFLLWLFIGCVFVGICFFPLFRAVAFRHEDIKRYSLTMTDEQLILFSWAISVAIAGALFLLGGFHCYLVLTNQTTLEVQNTKKVYDIGVRENFKQVFGRRLSNLIAFCGNLPQGDGINFPMT